MTKLRVEGYINTTKNIKISQYSAEFKKLVKASYLHYDKLFTRMKSNIRIIDKKPRVMYDKLHENPLTMVGATLAKDFLLLIEKDNLEQNLLASFNKHKDVKIINYLEILFDDMNAESINLLKNEIFSSYKKGKLLFNINKEIDNYLSFIKDDFTSFISLKNSGYRDITKLPIIALTAQKNIVYAFKGRNVKNLLWVSISFNKKQELLANSSNSYLENKLFNVLELTGFDLSSNLKIRGIVPFIDRNLFKVSYTLDDDNIEVVYSDKGILNLDLSRKKISLEENLKDLFQKELLKAGKNILLDIQKNDIQKDSNMSSNVLLFPAYLFQLNDKDKFKKIITSVNFIKSINNELKDLDDTRNIDITNKDHILFFKLINVFLYKGYKYKFLTKKEVINYFSNLGFRSGSYAAFLTFISNHLNKITQIELNKNITRLKDLEKIFNESMIIAKKELKSNSSSVKLRKKIKDIFMDKKYNEFNLEKYLAFLSTLNSDLGDYLDDKLFGIISKKIKNLKNFKSIKKNSNEHKILFYFLQILVAGYQNHYISEEFYLNMINDLDIGEDIYKEMMNNHNFRKIISSVIKVNENKHDDKFKILNKKLSEADVLMVESADKLNKYYKRENNLKEKSLKEFEDKSKKLINENNDKDQLIINTLIENLKTKLKTQLNEDIKKIKKNYKFYLIVTLNQLFKMKSTKDIIKFFSKNVTAWKYISYIIGKDLGNATVINNKEGSQVFYAILESIARLSYKQSYNKVDVSTILNQLVKIGMSAIYEEQVSLFKEKIFQNRDLLEKKVDNNVVKIFKNINSDSMIDNKYSDLMKLVLMEKERMPFVKKRTNVNTFLKVYDIKSGKYSDIVNIIDIKSYSHNIIEPLLKENSMMGIKLLFALFNKIYTSSDFVDIKESDLFDAFTGFNKLNNSYFNLLSVLIDSVNSFRTIGRGETNKEEFSARLNYQRVSTQLIDGFIDNPDNYIFANCDALSYSVSTNICMAFNSMISEIFKIKDDFTSPKASIDVSLKDGSSSLSGEIVDRKSDPVVKLLEKENDVILENDFLTLVENNSFNVNIYKHPGLSIQEDNTIKLIFIELMSMINRFYEKNIPAKKAVNDFYNTIKNFDTNLSLAINKGLLKLILNDERLDILTLSPEDNGDEVVKNLFNVFTNVLNNKFELIPISKKVLIPSIPVDDKLNDVLAEIHSIFNDYLLSKEIIENKKDAFFVDSDKIIFLKEQKASSTVNSSIDVVASSKSKNKDNTSKAIDMVISSLGEDKKEVSYLIENGALLDKFVKPNGREVNKNHNFNSKFDKALLYFQKRLYNAPNVMDMMFLLSNIFAISDITWNEIEKNKNSILNKIEDQVSELLMEHYLSDNSSVDFTINDIKNLVKPMTSEKLYNIFISDLVDIFDKPDIDNGLYESVVKVMKTEMTLIKDYIVNTMSSNLKNKVNSSIRSKVFKLDESKLKENPGKRDIRMKLYDLFNNIDRDYIEMIVSANEDSNIDNTLFLDDKISPKGDVIFSIINELGGLLTTKEIKNQMYSIIEDFKINLPSIIDDIQKNESVDIINVADAFKMVSTEVYNMQVDSTITKMLTISKIYDYWAAREVLSQVNDEMEKFDQDIEDKRSVLNINNVDGEGKTALHTAIIQDNDEVLWLLLNSGADPDIPDNDGLTPFALAALHNNVKVAKILYNNKASLKKGVPKLVSALESGLKQAIRDKDDESVKFWKIILREVASGSK